MKFFRRYHLAGQSLLHNPVPVFDHTLTVSHASSVPKTSSVGEPFILACQKSLLIDPWRFVFHS